MFVYGAVTMAILIAIATVALVVTPPGPPALAEFAPRATERIDEALKSQSSSFGDGDGGACADGQDCATGEGGEGGRVRSTSTTQPVIERPKVKRCVGDPPRQTEDPQSPPCIGHWEGDNGGATAKGVTRDEIRIAVPQGAGEPETREVVEHFNRRYQLYDRKLRVIPVEGGVDPKRLPEQADEVDAFAVLKTYNTAENLDTVEYHREARRRGILSTVGHSAYTSTDELRALEPFAWSYGPAIDEVQSQVASFVCSSLGTRPARFAGNELRLTPRRYAVFTSESRGRRVDFSPLNDGLRRCGVAAPRVHVVPRDGDRVTVSGIYRNLQDDGVTSVLLFSAVDNSTFAALQAPPTYHPEWIIAGVGAQENEAQWYVEFPADRRKSLFGVFMANKLLPAEETPSSWAYADAGSVPYHPFRRNAWYEPAWDFSYNSAYRSLLLLASGIQMAGPRLTPDTFAAGLRKARFPNPGAGGPPYYQAHVGFAAGDHMMSDGAAAVWWSDATESYGGGGLTRKGGWCYVRSGARFHAPSWPDVENELFNPDPARCR